MKANGGDDGRESVDNKRGKDEVLKYNCFKGGNFWRRPRGRVVPKEFSHASRNESDTG